MASRIDFVSDWGGSSAGKYPWHEWTDGSTWQIRRGEDYVVATENMRVNLHVKAGALGCKVRTKKVTDAQGESLVFQYLLPEELGVIRVSDPKDDPSLDAAVKDLHADCHEIYERARHEVTIPRKDGSRQKYAAVRFIQQVDRAYEEGTLLEAVMRVVHRRTQGFDHLAAAGRYDLMLETYLLDDRKPYHSLLPQRTLDVCRERMAGYRNLGEH